MLIIMILGNSNYPAPITIGLINFLVFQIVHNSKAAHTNDLLKQFKDCLCTEFLSLIRMSGHIRRDSGVVTRSLCKGKYVNMKSYLCVLTINHLINSYQLLATNGGFHLQSPN